MKNAIFCIMLLTSIAVHTPASYSEELAGVSMADNLAVGGTSLVLNGVGLRKATIFGVKVYVAGLYLPEKQSSAETILANLPMWKLTMKFVRSVSAAKLQNGWQEGFEKNVTVLDPLKTRIAEFNAMMDEVDEGDEISLTYSNKKTQVSVNGADVGAVEGEDFGRAVLSIWLGSNPPNKELKTGLLGG